MSNTPTIQFPEPLGFFFDQSYCRYRIAYGGLSSGKSWTAAQALIVRALQKKIRILCCREIQNSIKVECFRVFRWKFGLSACRFLRLPRCRNGRCGCGLAFSNL